MKRRVVVTGLGVVSSLGHNLEVFWDHLIKGESNVVVLEGFEESGLKTWIGAPALPVNVDDFDFLDKRDGRRLDSEVLFGVTAGYLALQDANTSGTPVLDYYVPSSRGVMTGCGVGGIKTNFKETDLFGKQGLKPVSPFYVVNFMGNAVLGQLSKRLKLQGPVDNSALACSSSVASILNAYNAIAYGEANMMLAGGQEDALTPATFAGFNKIGALSTRNDNPNAASRPFDRDRDGFVSASGGAFLHLENLEDAVKRGAKIYAEILGGAKCGEGYDMVAPHPEGEGAYSCMMRALLKAELTPQDLSYINTHGTATGVGDVSEAKAINRLLGDLILNVPINSTKSILGHLLGGAGAIETVATLLQMHYQKLHPSINCENQDPELNAYVVKTAQDHRIKYALVNSFGFGGVNTSLVVCDVSVMR